MAVFKILLFCLWLFVLPFINGFPLAQKQERNAGFLFQALLYGISLELALFEFLAVPMTFMKCPLKMLCCLWAALTLLLAAFSFIKYVWPMFQKKMRDGGIPRVAADGSKTSSALDEPGTSPGKSALEAARGLRTLRARCTPLLVVTVVCVLLQAAYVTLNQHIDDDDAYYVATAVTAVETDTLMEYNPYTGNLYSKLPSRYVLSAWPLYLAALSVLSGGLHPTLIAHFLLPGLIVLFAYLIYALIAQDFFPGDGRRQGIFLLFIILILSFSGFSVYSSGTFLFIRGWQGKALVAGISVPALFYLCRHAMADADGFYAWFSLFCVVTTTCLFSSMGVVISLISVGVYALVYGIKDRQWRYLPYAVLSCGTALLSGAVYLLIS